MSQHLRYYTETTDHQTYMRLLHILLLKDVMPTIHFVVITASTLLEKLSTQFQCPDVMPIQACVRSGIKADKEAWLAIDIPIQFQRC